LNVKFVFGAFISIHNRFYTKETKEKKKDKMIDFVPLESPCLNRIDVFRIFPVPILFQKLPLEKGFFFEPLSRISLAENEKKKE
jgi:hypothetical protein